MGLPDDGNGHIVQVGYDINVEDGAGTPVGSPKSIAASAEQEITVPANAVEINVFCETDIYFAKETSATEYGIIPAGQMRSLPCTGVDSFFFTNSDSGNAVDLYFDFIIV